MNWIIDPTPPASAIHTPPSEARPKLPGRSRRRRRRKKKATAAANGNSAPRTADVTAPVERTANDNLAHWRATRPRSAANNRPGVRSTPVKYPLSFTSSPLSQPPISAANQNGERASGQDHSENLGLYKPASTDPLLHLHLPNHTHHHLHSLFPLPAPPYYHTTLCFTLHSLLPTILSASFHLCCFFLYT